MIAVHVETPYASFRKSFARSFAETYALPPPATIYGMLLSLVGEHFRARHEGVKLAFAFKQMPRIATTIRRLSRYKYGVPSKQATLGNAPDFVETVCNIEFICWVNSDEEKADENGNSKGETLETRLLAALQTPQYVTRSGVLSLGLSDDAVNDISLCKNVEGKWHRLLPNDKGSLELPVWVDHVGAANTRWQRYDFEKVPTNIEFSPGAQNWRWTQIIAPRPKK